MSATAHVRHGDRESPFLSVIVCTHNRAALLPGCLESLAAQDLAAEHYEVLVVENACADETRAALEAFSRRYPNFHGVREPRPGKARALNTGLRNARGTHVAFVDDDAHAPPQWLRKIATTFRETSPQPAVIVGRIDYLYEQPPPAWWIDLPEREAGFLTTRIDIVSRVAGSNLAVHRQSLLDCGGFAIELGPVGDRFRLGEDTEAVLRVAARHPRVWYDPTITVRHSVPEDRMTLRYMAKRRFLSGMALSEIEGAVLFSTRTIESLLYRRHDATGSTELRVWPHSQSRFVSPGVSLARFTLRVAEELGRVCGARVLP